MTKLQDKINLTVKEAWEGLSVYIVLLHDGKEVTPLKPVPFGECNITWTSNDKQQEINGYKIISGVDEDIFPLDLLILYPGNSLTLSFNSWRM